MNTTIKVINSLSETSGGSSRNVNFEYLRNVEEWWDHVKYHMVHPSDPREFSTVTMGLFNPERGYVQRFMEKCSEDELNEVLLMVQIMVDTIKEMVALHAGNLDTGSANEHRFKYLVHIWRRILYGDGISIDKYAKNGLYYTIHQEERPEDGALYRAYLKMKTAYIVEPHVSLLEKARHVSSPGQSSPRPPRRRLSSAITTRKPLRKGPLCSG